MARSVAFIVMVVLQLAHSFCVRSIRSSTFSSSPWRNKWMLFAFCLSLGLTVAGLPFSLFRSCHHYRSSSSPSSGLYWPGLAAWLELQPIEGKHWVIVLIALVIHLIWIEAEKFVLRAIRRRERLKKAKLGATLNLTSIAIMPAENVSTSALPQPLPMQQPRAPTFVATGIASSPLQTCPAIQLH